MTSLESFHDELDQYVFASRHNAFDGENSSRVNVDVWDRYLDGMPVAVKIRPSAKGSISRTDLRELAQLDRDEASDRSVLELFWNVMAWGVEGSFRNTPGLTNYVRDNTDNVVAVLREGQQLSFQGNVKGAYDAIDGRVKYLGPAFFTKFLFFTADHNKPGHALILDERVRVAWRVLAGSRLAKSAIGYVEYCSAVGVAAKRLQIDAGHIEIALYHLGQKAGSYETWLLANLAICQKRLGSQSPTIADVLAELEQDDS